MPRSVAPALLLLAGLGWLIVGLVVAALVAGPLLAGLPDDDPRRATILLSVVLIGGTVAVLGTLATYRVLRRRSKSSGIALPWTTSRGAGATPVVTPNTLRGDATKRPQSAGGRPTSPVPPAPRPGMASASSGRPSVPGQRPSASAPAPAPGRGATGSSGAWRWTAASPGAAQRGRAPIPGAQTVATSRAAAPSTGQWEASPPKAGPIPEVLAIVAGVLLLGSSDWTTIGSWLVPVLLLVVSGAFAAAGGSSPFGAPVREAALAVAPSAIASALAVSGGTAEVESTLMRLLVLFIGAWITVNVGMVGAGAVGSSRN